MNWYTLRNEKSIFLYVVAISRVINFTSQHTVHSYCTSTTCHNSFSSNVQSSCVNYHKWDVHHRGYFLYSDLNHYFKLQVCMYIHAYVYCICHTSAFNDVHCSKGPINRLLQIGHTKTIVLHSIFDLDV